MVNKDYQSESKLGQSVTAQCRKM